MFHVEEMFELTEIRKYVEQYLYTELLGIIWMHWGSNMSKLETK